LTNFNREGFIFN